MAKIEIKNTKNTTIFGSSVLGKDAEMIIDGGENQRIYNTHLVDEKPDSNFKSIRNQVIAGIIVLFISGILIWIGIDI